MYILQKKDWDNFRAVYQVLGPQLWWTMPICLQFSAMSIFEISQRPIWTASSSPQSHIDTRLGLDNECHVLARQVGWGRLSNSGDT